MSVRNILRGAASGSISIVLFSFLYTVYKNLHNRYSKIPKLGERVVVLGASSGIGRSIARQYAERGARVCIVGRRESLVNEVVAECCQSVRNILSSSSDKQEENIFAVAADFANVDDMIRTRTIVEASKVQAFHSSPSFTAHFFFFLKSNHSEWKGFDTLVVAAGVSAVQPLMAIAGVDADSGDDTSVVQATKEGIQRVADVAAAATRGNYVGPLISATTFVSFFSSISR